MVRLVFRSRDVDVAVEWARCFQKSRRGVLESILDEVLREGLSEAKVVDYVGYVGHVSRKVVASTLGLDVKVPGSTVHEEESGELAAGVVSV